MTTSVSQPRTYSHMFGLQKAFITSAAGITTLSWEWKSPLVVPFSQVYHPTSTHSHFNTIPYHTAAVPSQGHNVENLFARCITATCIVPCCALLRFVCALPVAIVSEPYSVPSSPPTTVPSPSVAVLSLSILYRCGRDTTHTCLQTLL